MKRNQIVSLTAACTILLFAIITIVSCSKQGGTPIINGTNIQLCKNVVCQNAGTCINGICNCPAGFEGKECEAKWSAGYAANYEANDECQAGKPYAVKIEQVINRGDAILISNITSYNTSIEARLAPNKTTFNLLPKKIGDNIYITGIGTQTESTSYINMWVSARDSFAHTTQSCSIVLRKL
jgi:hypothetical protein